MNRLHSYPTPHEQVAGRVIDNPISGERIVIRESGVQTGGRLLSFDLFLPPGGHVPARHVHPIQEEQFTVVAGRMRFAALWIELTHSCPRMSDKDTRRWR